MLKHGLQHAKKLGVHVFINGNLALNDSLQPNEMQQNQWPTTLIAILRGIRRIV
jgi:hypothetical protein